MLIAGDLAVLHVPRCGGTRARHLLAGAHQAGLAHDGYQHLPATWRGRPGAACYVLLREPLGWYASLHGYTWHRGTWPAYLGLDDTRPAWTAWPDAARRYLVGGPSPGELDGNGTMTPADPLAGMAEAGIGLWSWFALRAVGLGRPGDGPGQPLAPVRVLWLGPGREADLQALARRHGVAWQDDGPGHRRNGSSHPEPARLFGPELRALVEQRDGPTLARLRELPTGLA